MTAKIINLLASSQTPRYRPMPTEPAIVIFLPIIRIEPFVECQIRATISDFERKMRAKYRLGVATELVTDKPCDS